MVRRAVLTALLALGIAGGMAAASPTAGAQPLEVKNGRLFYCGQPIRLVGYTDYGLVAESSFQHVSFFNTLKSYGVNFVRVWLVYHWTYDLLPFQGPYQSWDLTKYNPQFYDRLRKFVAAAEKRGIIVQLNFFDSVCLENSSSLRWARCPFNAKNNTKNYCQSSYEFEKISGPPPIWNQVNRPLV